MYSRNGFLPSQRLSVQNVPHDAADLVGLILAVPKILARRIGILLLPPALLARPNRRDALRWRREYLVVLAVGVWGFVG